MNKAFDGVSVLEIAEGISGPYCGKLMAGMGADVTKIEPLQGDSARAAGPFRNDQADPEASGLFLYLNTGKKNVTLDLQDADAAAFVLEMALEADVVIDNYPPSWLNSLGLGYEALSRSNPGLIFVSITPFGQIRPLS